MSYRVSHLTMALTQTLRRYTFSTYSFLSRLDPPAARGHLALRRIYAVLLPRPMPSRVLRCAMRCITKQLSIQLVRSLSPIGLLHDEWALALPHG